MNCLLLLIILCCCGQGNHNQGCWSRTCGNVASNDNCCDNNFTVTDTNECGCNLETKEEEKCGCNRMSNSRNNEGNAFTAPPVARAQYPYLDLEPHTCGCEEKK